MGPPPTGEEQYSPVPQAAPALHRQVGAAPLVSHHSPDAQHPVPQHAPVVHFVQVVSGPQRCPLDAPAPPAPAPPPVPPLPPCPPVPAFPPSPAPPPDPPPVAPLPPVPPPLPPVLLPPVPVVPPASRVPVTDPHAPVSPTANPKSARCTYRLMTTSYSNLRTIRSMTQLCDIAASHSCRPQKAECGVTCLARVPRLAHLGRHEGFDATASGQPFCEHMSPFPTVNPVQPAPYGAHSGCPQVQSAHWPALGTGTHAHWVMPSAGLRTFTTC